MDVSGTVSTACYYSLVSHNFCRFCRSECLDNFSTCAVDRDTLESSCPHHVSLFQAEKALCMFPRHYTVTTSFCRELMGKLGFDSGRGDEPHLLFHSWCMAGGLLSKRTQENLTGHLSASENLRHILHNHASCHKPFCIIHEI